MRPHRLVAIASLQFVATACAPSADPGGAQESPVAAVEQAAPGQHAYVFDDDGMTIRLVDGAYEDAEADEAVTLIAEVVLEGDLDGDGSGDRVVLLVRNTGGSGVFTYLAPLLAAASGSPAPTTFVGDRVQLRGWGLEGARVRLDVVEAGPQDALCCPGEMVTRRWYLDNGRLLEDFTEITGRLGVSAIAGDWQLAAWDLAEPFDSLGLEVTLRVADGQVSGGSGCNRYTGTIADGEGVGAVVIGPLAGTRMACSGIATDVETRFLQALGTARSIGFHLGRLALGYDTAGGPAMLLFAPATEAEP